MKKMFATMIANDSQTFHFSEFCSLVFLRRGIDLETAIRDASKGGRQRVRDN